MAKTESAVFQVFIRGTLEQVWHQITKTNEPIESFFNCRMHTSELGRNGKMAMRTPDGKYTAVVGEILEFDPPHKFSHTFRFTQYDDPPCKVTYELKKAEGGVDFTLRIDDMPSGTKTAKQMISGGKMIVNTLKAMVETGRPSFGTRMLYRIFKWLAFMTPKKCLSENWPL